MATYLSKPMGLIHQGRLLLPGKFVYQGSMEQTDSSTGLMKGQSVNVIKGASGNRITITPGTSLTHTSTNQVYILKTSDGLYIPIMYDGTNWIALVYTTTSQLPATSTAVTAYPAYISYWAINGYGSHIIGALTSKDYVNLTSQANRGQDDVAVYYKIHKGEYLKDFAITFIMGNFISPSSLSQNIEAGASSGTVYRYANFPGQEANPIERGEAGVLDKLIFVFTPNTGAELGQLKVDNSIIQIADKYGNYYNYFTFPKTLLSSTPYYIDDYISCVVNTPKIPCKRIEVLTSPDVKNLQSVIATFISSSNINPGDVILLPS